MILLLIIFLIFLDQLSKYLVRAGFEVGESIPIFKDIFYITHAENKGVAFNLFTGVEPVVKYLPLVFLIICAIILIYTKKKKYPLVPTSLMLILSGGAGNLIDRFCFGKVTDMFDFKIFPIFNVADMYVTVGIFLLIIYLIFFEKKNKKDESTIE